MRMKIRNARKFKITLLGRKEKRRKKVIQLFSHSLNETGVVTKKEEEGKRTKYSRN
jgi:hypothetical protein